MESARRQTFQKLKVIVKQREVSHVCISRILKFHFVSSRHEPHETLLKIFRAYVRGWAHVSAKHTTVTNIVVTMLSSRENVGILSSARLSPKYYPNLWSPTRFQGCVASTGSAWLHHFNDKKQMQWCIIKFYFNKN